MGDIEEPVTDEPSDSTQTVGETYYNSMTKSQLQQLLTDLEIEWKTSMTKSELITLIEGSG